MRSDCAWSMSTVGLTAQEISFPIEYPFLQGRNCHSMAGSKPSWSYRHEPTDNFYFSMDTHIDRGYQSQQRGSPQSHKKSNSSPKSQRLLPKKSRPSHLSLSSSAEPSTPSPADDDQVVPSFKRLSFYESSPPSTPDRYSKPLPPIPPQTDISAEQAMDSEVEFFTRTDDSCRLVSNEEQYSKPSFRYGLSSRRSLRDPGKINYGYNDGPLGPQTQQQPQPQHHQTHPPHEVRQQQRQEPPKHVVCPTQQDKAQRKLRRSHSGPAGSLHKPSLLRLCQKRYTNGTGKSEVPPPIPPRNTKTGDMRRWSAEVSSGAYSDEDKPPKLPPRARGISRTPSPSSIPTYANGIMPPTQSFAPDPKYVSGRCFHRQNSEGSPCILPVMVDGETSHTHYYLMPQRSVFADSDCDCHTKRKVDFV
ncbi:ERBB receptor feedback inhibitor 1a [Cyprinodon tularosa]|uniref:ERBB receptor feedback inhibitor 1a n=1 Tax=Cyprinodon tularosa TaxID=77115 RepID=UPI0018E22458|nr:ERBB receptor feedback inhibitor 1a [Cyprinodon tularosa]